MIDLMICQCDRFIESVNIKLSPIAEIIRNTDRSFPSFEVNLVDNIYFMKSQLVILESFEKMINEMGKLYFGFAPSFNNTGTSFWFIQKEGEK